MGFFGTFSRLPRFTYGSLGYWVSLRCEELVMDSIASRRQDATEPVGDRGPPLVRIGPPQARSRREPLAATEPANGVKVAPSLPATDNMSD